MKRTIINLFTAAFLITFGFSLYGCPIGKIKSLTPSTMEKKPANPLPPISGDQINAPNLPASISWKKYTSSSPAYSLSYPSTYTLEENKTYQAGITVVKIMGPKGKMAIYSEKDLPGGPTWIFPHSGGGERGWLPTDATEELKPVTGEEGVPIGIWLFYDSADTETKAELHKIVDSIKVPII